MPSLNKKQKFNQLSRFQKNLVVIVCLSVILLCGFVFIQRQQKDIDQEPGSSQLAHVIINKRSPSNEDEDDDDKIRIMPFKVSRRMYLFFKHLSLKWTKKIILLLSDSFIDH